MINLYAETIDVLKDNGKTESDILWVGLENYCRLNMSKGLKALFDFEYDNSYGGEEIRNSLIIVGDDWWLERHEYDGSEWWEFKTLPKMPDAFVNEPTLKNIVGDAYFWHQEWGNKTYENNTNL